MPDENLEAAIDNAGRDRVFAIMRAAGWSSLEAPPKWCWWEAVRIAHRDHPTAAGERLSVAV